LAHAFFGFPTGWLCHRTADRLAYMISLRGSDVPGANARLQFEYELLGPLVFKPIWKKAAAIVACSEGLRQRALRFMPDATIQVICNGVDLGRFHPSPESDGPPRLERPLRLLTVGRLSGTKRVDLLIETVDALRCTGHDVRLTVIGDGPLRQDLAQMVAERSLSDVVDLAGRLEGQQMPQVYRDHDMLVSASMQEGMSNAMLEAMASGLPIVCTRCEGVDELIDGNGLVVENAGAQGLAEAVIAIESDPDRWRRMHQAARDRASRFSWQNAAQQYIGLYRRIVDK
jgi:glycosyltransferase involved in cell wall biosynthesis